MVDAGEIDVSHITASHARQVSNFTDDKLNALLKKVWGTVRQTSDERKSHIAEISDLMTEQRINQADLENGQIIFAQVCGGCHRMFGKGGQIGPDLTGADRSNLHYLLENIMDPSATLATSYRSSLILLEDGRLIGGVVVEETDRVLGVQTKDEIVKIDKTTIEERKESDQSLMPEGLLNPLNEDQKVDLIAWLLKAGK
jgi:putative heme-binding domain-containing protein